MNKHLLPVLLLSALLTACATTGTAQGSSGGASGTSALMQAVLMCDNNTIRLLIEKGADVNAADENGDTGITLTSSGLLTDAQGTNPNPLMQVYDIAAPIVKDAKKIPATILSPTRLYDIATTTGETVEFKTR